jgi:hypothetical protein
VTGWDTAGVAELPLSPAVIESLVAQLTEPCRYIRLVPNDVEWAATIVNRDGTLVLLSPDTHPVWTTSVAHLPLANQGPDGGYVHLDAVLPTEIP